jgi:NADPH-dependent curcumin reductase CurA
MPFLHDPETQADTAERRVKARTRKNCILFCFFVFVMKQSDMPMCRYADMPICRYAKMPHLKFKIFNPTEEMSSFTPIVICKTIILKDVLGEGIPGPEHFKIEEKEFPLEENKKNLKEGSVIVEVKVISADPYLRGMIKPTGYIKGGSPMVGFVTGKILVSKNAEWSEGDIFGSRLPFSTYQVLASEQLGREHMWKLTGMVDPNHLSLGIGILGMPGSTAYGGLTGILQPKQGETIFISAASGAVGGLVGMIAKNVFNCTVIGSCGGPEKCEFIKSYYGFDHAIDYKKCSTKEDLIRALKAVAPLGIDMYFENVGGIHFEAAFACLRQFGRIAICGWISEYNKSEIEGVRFNPAMMIYTYQRIEGFVCAPWLSGQKGNFLVDMSQWLQEGKLKVQETPFEGIENWPMAFQSLFTGTNLGKVVVNI